MGLYRNMQEKCIKHKSQNIVNIQKQDCHKHVLKARVVLLLVHNENIMHILKRL